MMIPPIIENEDARLAAVHSLALLDTPPESAFDEIVELAAWTCHAPMAAITLIDEARQWLKSSVGLDIAETDRDIAFCAHSIAGDTTLIVPDTQLDRRFGDNPLVTDDAGIRFYAGAPIYVDGHAVGTLCVLDTRPRSLFSDERRALEILARQVEARLFTQRLEWRFIDQLTQVSTDLAVARWMTCQDTTRQRAVLHFDIDGLDSVNAAGGREAGDAALVATARALQSSAPMGALVARHHDDEFLVLIEQVETEALHQQIDQFRIALAGRLPAGVEVSLGLATASEHAPGDDLIEAATRATQLEKQFRQK